MAILTDETKERFRERYSKLSHEELVERLIRELGDDANHAFYKEITSATNKLEVKEEIAKIIMNRLKDNDVLDTIMFGNNLDYTTHKYVVDKTKPSTYVSKLLEDAFNSKELKDKINVYMNSLIEKMYDDIINNLDKYVASAVKQMFIDSITNSNSFRNSTISIVNKIVGDD